MKITVSNSFAKIVDASEDELEWVANLLSIEEAYFRKDWKTGRAKRFVRQVTFLKRDKRFPAGFIRSIWRAAKKRGFVIELTGGRPEVPSHDPDAELEWLRYYQLAAVQRVIERRRGIIWHPTGSGKTELAIGLTIAIPCKWLFLVQSKDLMHQTARRYEERLPGAIAGRIGDSMVEPVNDPLSFNVATIQTLNAKRGTPKVWDLVKEAEGLIVDECHGVPATTVYRVIEAANNAGYRVGLSGTPMDRSDEKSLLSIGALGPVIHKVEAEELIQKGWLSRPKIKMVKCHQESVKRYQGAYGELIIRSTQRNRLLVDLMQQATKPSFCFVKNIKHGKALAERAARAGLNVEFVWGDKHTKQRGAAIERLVRNDIDAIICSKVFNLGIDVPELRSIIIGTSGKSVIEVLQRMGRGMRVTPDKSTFEVFDVYDVGHKNLQEHSRVRRRAYEKAGHKVTLVETLDDQKTLSL
jgi:superfamily II DNA or RNA helicase